MFCLYLHICAPECTIRSHNVLSACWSEVSAEHKINTGRRFIVVDCGVFSIYYVTKSDSLEIKLRVKRADVLVCELEMDLKPVMLLRSRTECSSDVGTARLLSEVRFHSMTARVAMSSF